MPNATSPRLAALLPLLFLALPGCGGCGNDDQSSSKVEVRDADPAPVEPEIKPEEQRQASLAALKELGASIQLDANGKLRSVNLYRNRRLTDDDLAQLAPWAESLSVLDLRETGVSDTGLEFLAGLTRLEQLYLGRTRVTDDGLAHLSKLKSLRVLNLERLPVSGEGLTRQECTAEQEEGS